MMWFFAGVSVGCILACIVLHGRLNLFKFWLKRAHARYDALLTHCEEIEKMLHAARGWKKKYEDAQLSVSVEKAKTQEWKTLAESYREDGRNEGEWWKNDDPPPY